MLIKKARLMKKKTFIEMQSAWEQENDDEED